MTTRHKLILINGTIDQEGSILMYQTVNSFEIHCYPYTIAVPPLPFPDDDRDDFDPAE
ncbi:MAG: hypothetical protein OXI59_21325 [Gemmatimonadota bacterium]|nr:hypothetical protein [Gemmatimonadota bacterium]